VTLRDKAGPGSDITVPLGYPDRRNPALRTEPGGPVSAIEDHLEHLRLLGHSATTIYGRMTFLRMLARALEAQKDPAVKETGEVSRPGPRSSSAELLQATPADLAAWRAGLGVSDDVIVHYVSAARSFYAFCVRRGLAGGNPAAGLPVPRTGRRLPRPVSEADLMYALAEADERIRPWLVLAGWAGFRAIEIARLRRESVLDTARPPVLIAADGATKGHRERSVPMSAFVLAELVPVLPASGWVFLRRDGKKGPNSPGLVSHLANEHLHACGVAASLHQLRHRFLSQAWHASYNLRLIQELAGHARPETSAGYTVVDSPEAVAAVEAIPAPKRLRRVAAG
jgi:site-specific recombinase XerC